MTRGNTGASCVFEEKLVVKDSLGLGIHSQHLISGSSCQFLCVPQFLDKHRYGIFVSKYLLYWDDREVVSGDERTTVKCSTSVQTDRGF